jgi:hypothetical protein
MSMSMETRPFSIQSPEAIAKEYGGNKQKIAQAMQMGIIDPTAGTLAGMFIDRMRAAAQQEQAPQQTIAQQIMAPPQQMSELDTTLQAAFGPPPSRGGEAPPAGLGATPEAAQMMAPPMEQAMAPPPMEQPMGMAAGGMLPPYMNSGGLADLPVPDTMFDEPHDGSYAGGGIVAFAAGTPRGVKEAEAKPKPPENLFGYTPDPMALVEEYRRLYKPKTEASERARQLYGDVLSEEGQKKRRNEDIGSFLMNFGGNLASTTNPGGFLGSVGDSLVATAPMLREASKERRAEQREAIKQLALDEGASNEEARREADLYMQGKGRYAELAQTAQKNKEDREFQLKQFEGQQALGYAQIDAQDRASRAAAAARNNLDFTEKNAEIIYQQLKARNDRLPYYKGTAKFFDKNQYQRTDQALRAEAYERAAKMRYFDPATNPLTQNRAAVIGKVLGPDGGGEQGVTTVAWPSPKS